MNLNNAQQICKHILWVYLFVLKVPEESRLINQVALVESEVVELFSNAPAIIPPRLFRKSSTSGVPSNSTPNTHPSSSSSGTPSSCRTNSSSQKTQRMTVEEMNGLFEASSPNKNTPAWTVRKKDNKGKEPMCAGCRNSKIVPGRIYIHVSALYIPVNCNFCVSRNFYFCANLNCLSKKPLASKLQCPPHHLSVSNTSETFLPISTMEKLRFWDGPFRRSLTVYALQFFVSK